MKRIGNVIRAQGVAMKLIEEYGFRRPAEIDLDSLIIDRGVEVRRGALRGCEARLVRIGQRGIIRVRDGVVGSPRSRFTLSHELGHWELHTDTQAFICTKEKFRDYKTDVKEAEANTFASELLMPTFMVRPLIHANEPSLSTAKLIADKFNVSLTAAAIRLLLETKHECFLVVSKDGHVQWWLSGSDRFGLWMESKQPLGPETLAYHLCGGAQEATQPEVVPTEAWFRHLDAPERLEISEDSLRLGYTGAVLTILVLVDTD
jgi:hypothetical protein